MTYKKTKIKLTNKPVPYTCTCFTLNYTQTDECMIYSGFMNNHSVNYSATPLCSTVKTFTV